MILSHVSNKTHSAIRRFVLGSFLSAAVLAGGGAAYAADGAGDKPAPHQDKDARRENRPMDPARLIKRLDKNGDGKLTVAELPEKAQKRLGQADTNKDGILSVEELKAHAEQRTKARAAKQKAHFARKDKNGDGALTKDEVGEKRWERVKAADANRDNKVSADELRAAHAARKTPAAR
ncbi:EF-hand domain-containing protein [Sorangium sp. So ce1000]|uniref:EF-hand domain-containing protein n=1 Tax=Sorangium sp. So ce1000 TaxID=3133325 RepID=UPI003F640713